jgi:hypothetical protein
VDCKSGARRCRDPRSATITLSRRGDGPDFTQLCANLGRNLLEGRLGMLTAVFEAV